MRDLAKNLETKEAETAIVEEEIQKLEQNIQYGTDESSSEKINQNESMIICNKMLSVLLCVLVDCLSAALLSFRNKSY